MRGMKRRQISFSNNLAKITLFCFFIFFTYPVFGEPVSNNPLQEAPISDKPVSESEKSPSHQVSELSESNEPVFAQPVHTKESIFSIQREAPLPKREYFRFNVKAGLGYSLFSKKMKTGSISNTYIVSSLLELEIPFQNTDFRWLLQGGGGAAFNNQFAIDPYFSAHTGIKYNFRVWTASFTAGFFRSELMYYTAVSVISLGWPFFSNKMLLEANVGFINFILPTYFILSLSFPLAIF